MRNNDITNYVEREILPRYQAFDKGHGPAHATSVISRSLEIVATMPEVDPAYVVAAFHDLGLVNGRENRHHDSRLILEADPFVRSHFTDNQIALMGEAVEDHRASSGHRPRNIYGLILAEADRLIDPDIIVRRCLQYGLANYTDFDSVGQRRRAIDHIVRKYGPDGYLTIWIEGSPNARNLALLRQPMADTPKFHELIDRIYREEVNNN